MTQNGECPDAQRKGDIVRQGERIIANHNQPSDPRWASEKTLTDDYRSCLRYVVWDHLPKSLRFSTATVLREAEARSLPIHVRLVDQVLREAVDARRLIYMGNDCWAAVRGTW